MATELKSPQQQIFDAVFLIAKNLGYSTFDYLPPKEEGVPYPFVFIGEQFDQDQRTKSMIYGNIQQTVHIFHTYKKRRELTTMMDKLKIGFRKLKRTDNFYVRYLNINAQTIIDNSTGEPLLHGIIEVEYQFH
ncbi:MAG: hypothetical protein ACQEWU_05225 [Bacillota bacterium]